MKGKDFDRALALVALLGDLDPERRTHAMTGVLNDVVLMLWADVVPKKYRELAREIEALVATETALVERRPDA